MGLLDDLTYDPQMALGMGLLSAGGNSRMPVSFGQGLGSAWGNMQDTARAGQKAKLTEQHMLMQQSGLQEMQRKRQALDAFKAQLPPALQTQFDIDPQAFIKAISQQQEEYTLTPGAARFKGNQKLAEVPMKPNEAPLPWYVKPTPDGRMAIDPAYADLEKTKASFARPPAQPMAPVAYINDKGQTVWGTIAEAKGKPAANFNPTVQGQIAGAKEGAKTEAEERTKAALDAPRIVQNAETAIRLADELVKHPGFSQAVGKSSMLGLQKIPGTEAKDFINRLDQVKGSAFLEAFNSLKGGGQITEVEGKKATDAIARMDNATSEGEFKAAVKDYQDIIRKGAGRAKMKARPVAPATPVAAPSSSVDSLLEKYK